MSDQTLSEQSNSEDYGWVLVGRFRIDARDEDDAQRVLDRIERCARAPLGPGPNRRASLTVHVHGSEDSRP